MRRAAAFLAITLLVLAGCTSAGDTDQRRSGASTVGSSAAAAQTQLASTNVDWPTYHGNRARTGYGATIPTVNTAPKLLVTRKLDGAVYAEPIVVGGHTIIATENNTVYSFSPGGFLQWTRHLGSPSPAAQRPCGNIDPLGITGTPVYSPTTGLIYVAAELSGDPPTHALYALSTAGTVKWHRSLDLAGVDRRVMQERGALTLDGSGVWVPFGGLAGDCGNYKGRLVRVPRSGVGAVGAYTVPTTREAGMWTPPGPSVDATGYMYQSVGNGAAGVGDPYDFSDSVLKLDGSGHVVDYFSPTNWAQENDVDADLGSQGATLVGPWIFIAGKGGQAYVLRQSGLGHIGGSVSSMNLCRSFGGTAVVGNTVFVPCTDGLRAVTIDSTGHMQVKWHAAANILGSPVVGGGRVWTLDTAAGVLHALDPSTGTSLASVTVGSVTRFATPTLYGHLVYVGTTSGYVVVQYT
jgi:hypothetical protein